MKRYAILLFALALAAPIQLLVGILVALVQPSAQYGVRVLIAGLLLAWTSALLSAVASLFLGAGFCAWTAAGLPSALGLSNAAR